jgi:hypothetical protein
MKMPDSLRSWLKPVHPRPELLRIFDPLIATFAGAALLATASLGFGAFGVLLACAFLSYLILTRIFGISLDFDPNLFRQYAGPPTA